MRRRNSQAAERFPTTEEPVAIRTNKDADPGGSISVHNTPLGHGRTPTRERGAGV